MKDLTVKELSEKELEFLKQYASVYQEERKIDCTANPIVLVQNQVKEYTCGEYCNDGFDYELEINNYPFTEDGLISEYDELIEEIKEVLNEYNFDDEVLEEIEDDIDMQLIGFYSADEFEEEYEDIKIYIKKHYFKYNYQTVAYFLTRTEAEKYLKYQGHNLHKPRVYTDYAGYQNKGDYTALSKLLLKIGEKLNEVEE